MKRIIQNSLLVIASLLVLLAVLELAVRIHTSNYSFNNILEDHLRLSMASYPTQYDQDLGWAPRTGVMKQDRHVERITILPGGIRSNGDSAMDQDPPGERPILAVGDSYAFGYEVKDEETWPAILEQRIGRRVINGGVIAYGMDQTLLRMRQMIDRYQPDTVVFGFIPNDIWRCQIASRSGVNKPYFSVRNNALAVENIPVPEPAITDLGNPGIRKYLGYSAFMHFFMMRYGYGMWWLRGDLWKDRQVHDEATGQVIACLIIRELDQLAAERGIRVYLLAQYGKERNSREDDRSRQAIACARPGHLTVIDLREPLLEIRARDSEQYRQLFTAGNRHHMTYLGNQFVANAIQKAMEMQSVPALQ